MFAKITHKNYTHIININRIQNLTFDDAISAVYINLINAGPISLTYDDNSDYEITKRVLTHACMEATLND